ARYHPLCRCRRQTHAARARCRDNQSKVQIRPSAAMSQGARMSCLDGSRIASDDMPVWRGSESSLVFGLFVQSFERLLALMGVRELGRPSIDPELMIRMLIIGYSQGIRSRAAVVRRPRKTLGPETPAE